VDLPKNGIWIPSQTENNVVQCTTMGTPKTWSNKIEITRVYILLQIFCIDYSALNFIKKLYINISIYERFQRISRL
jgi:hypothetical protein